MTFSESLKKLRTQRGLTQDELADKTGMAKSSISMYETGSRKPSFEVLEAFADFFNVDMDELLGRNPAKSNNNQNGLPPLTPKDEREIARDLEKMLSAMDAKNSMAAMGGTVDDKEDQELLKASLLTAMRLAKQIAKKKFTPKKYRK